MHPGTAEGAAAMTEKSNSPRTTEEGMNEKICEHNYQYCGLKYRDSGDKLAGSGATRIDYYDVYCCTKCLEEQRKPVIRCTNSYQKTLEGSTPL